METGLGHYFLQKWPFWAPKPAFDLEGKVFWDVFFIWIIESWDRLFELYSFKSPSGREITNVVTEAIKFDVDMTTVPAAYIGLNGKAIPQSVWDEVYYRDLATAKRIYGPGSYLLWLRMKLEKRDIAGAVQGYGAFSLGGGIDGPVKWESIFIRGETATVSCRATVWAKSKGYNSGHEFIFTPHSSENFVFTLRREAKGWVVTDERFTFAPGSEP